MPKKLVKSFKSHFFNLNNVSECNNASQKNCSVKKDRKTSKAKEDFNTTSSSYYLELPKTIIEDSIKRKLIMKTIEDIKRSLEGQSLELNETLQNESDGPVKEF
jgi:hypothetical protein